MASEAQRRFGAVEAGGTKFVCAIGDESGRILTETRFPTTDPATTIAAMIACLRRQEAECGPLSAIGLASFGPIELNPASPQHGRILATPKPGWTGADITGALEREFALPVAIDTDVNAAALAEHRWGAAQDIEDLVYVTVGTGIGGGALVGGRRVHGLMHSEMGHLLPRRHALDATFPGVCPFHGDCIEGLASGPAIIARAGAPLEELGPDHPQWEIEADYLGQLCAQLVLALSPRRIILGGGVMNQSRLFLGVRRRTQHWLGGYVQRAELQAGIDDFIVAPRLGAQAGIKGALALALEIATVGATELIHADDNRAMAVLYAKNIATLQAFYTGALALAVEHAESDHVLLASRGFQLVILQVPDAIGSTITIADPPRRRSETPIKLVFEVASLAAVRELAPRFGGAFNPKQREWTYRGQRVCDGQDPEGNVIQCREKVPVPTAQPSSQ
jgi:fructokinase